MSIQTLDVNVSRFATYSDIKCALSKGIIYHQSFEYRNEQTENQRSHVKKVCHAHK